MALDGKNYQLGVLNPVPFRSIWGNDELRADEKESFISSGILKYNEFWKLGMLKDDSYSKVMGPYVKQWENILELLLRPIPRHNFVLLEGFWPSNNWRVNYEHASIPTIVDVDRKILSSFHIVALETCTLLLALLHTSLFVTCLLVILFLCSLQTI